LQNIGKSQDEHEGDRALGGKNHPGEFEPPQDHPGGPTDTKGGASGGPRGFSRKLWLPAGLDEEVNMIVEYLDIWADRAEFMRDAVRQQVKRWIHEARRVKRDLEKNK